MILAHGEISGQFQGATNKGLGVLGVVNGDVFSAQQNPSLLHILDSNQVGFNIQKVGFGGRALESSLAAKFGNAFTQFGIGFNYFGNAYFNQSTASLSIGKKLSINQSVGINFGAMQEGNILGQRHYRILAKLGYWQSLSQIISYGIMSEFVFKFGTFETENPHQLAQNKGAIGLKIKAQKGFEILPEVGIYQHNNPRLGLGFLFTEKHYQLMAGFANQDGLINAGIKIPFKELQMSFSYSFYQRLGSVVSSNLVYQW